VSQAQSHRPVLGPPVTPRPRRKSFFFRGLVAVLPVTLTIFILAAVVSFVQDYVTGPINAALYWSLEGNPIGWRVLRKLDIDPYHLDFLTLEALPADLAQLLEAEGLSSDAFRGKLAALRESRQTFLRDADELFIDGEKLRRAVKKSVHPLIGLLVSLLLVISLGSLVSGYLGRRVVSGVDRAMHQIPVVRSIYPYTKQVVEFFLAEKEIDLGTVVAAPYPAEGIWSIGFVTSSGLASVHEAAGGKFVSVFIASSPVPMTGYTVFIELERLIPLDITVDEALRAIVSVGVLIPPQERVEGLEEEMRRRLGRKPSAPTAAASPA
jgi:uncharacterized membrane protein